MRYNLKQLCAYVFLGAVLLVASFYFIAGDSIHFSEKSTEMVSLKAVTPPLAAGHSVRQRFVCEYDDIRSVTVLPGNYGRENTDTIRAEIRDGQDNVLGAAVMGTTGLGDAVPYTIPFDPPLANTKGQSLFLVLSSENGTDQNGVGFFYGDSMETARGAVPVEFAPEDLVSLDGVPLEGSLCLSVTGTAYYAFGRYYWYFALAVWLLLGGYLSFLIRCQALGKSTLGLRVLDALSRYRFLIHQLVSRDFKTKYKRSVLGVLWSLLNPLLSLLVQYVVFSTIFKSSVENFPIYLLTGIVCFNFFSEATGMCLTSIIGNGSLITKVYLPKYVLPLSRALSSGINLLLSLLTIFIFMLVTRTPVTLSVLLLPYGLICLFLFSLGVGLILATMMVFFRDTQFLWNVIVMMWMYLCPIFYPVSIIPDQLMPLYSLNPMYHIIQFFRTILIQGVSPEPAAYLVCLLMAAVPLTVGALVFKKNQDQFVLNI